MAPLRRALPAAALALFLAWPAAVPCQEAYPARVRILLPPSNSALPLLLLAAEDGTLRAAEGGTLRAAEDGTLRAAEGGTLRAAGEAGNLLPGVDFQAEIVPSQAQALAALLRGDAELLLTGTSQGWENYLDGGPLVMVGTGVWGVSWLMGPPQAPAVGSLADLAGKRIALPFPGAPLDFQTRYLARRQGLDPDRDLKLGYSSFPQSAALLAAGRLDAAAFPEPLASQLELHQGLRRLLSYQEMWAAQSGGDPRSPQVSLFATRAFAQKQRALLERLLELWREASRRVASDPAAASARFAATLGFPEEVVRLSIANTLFYVPSPEENRRRVELYYREVKEFLPGARGELEADFFFLP